MPSYLMLLINQISFAVIIITGLHRKTGMGLCLHISEKQNALIGIEEYLPIAGMTVGTPLFRDEITRRSIRVVKVRVDTVLIEVEMKFRHIIHDEIITDVRSVVDQDLHIQRRTTILAVLGDLLLGLGIHLPDMLELGLFVLSLKSHAKQQHDQHRP